MTETTATDPRAKLAGLEGRYAATARLWFKPGDEALENPFTLVAERAADGLAVVLRTEGAHGEDASVGVALLGVDAKQGLAHVTWVDSFHTGEAPMMFTGPLRDGAVVDVSTTYMETWGWRIEIAQEGEGVLAWRMFNRTPDGLEYPAFEALYRRQ